ncbi:MAG: serine protease [Ignavibacterium album]|jgi:hypothetical protein|uniref:Serine protease n=1 Tax=Ignavibacterium album TaxID=591197 RepID=A0A7V2ZM87_9BACT|nr:serine protease [Ignavibacterium album]MCX8104776.1 serine protease [Ignavibacterium album]
MKFKLVILSFTYLLEFIWAQAPIPEELLTSSVYIKLPNGMSATGFYFSDSINCFLVTAKHVFFEANDGKISSETADLISYPRDPYTSPPNLLSCNLKFLLKRNLVVFHQQFDVAVALIGEKEMIDSINAIIHYNESITKPDSKPSRVTYFYPSLLLESKDLLVGTDVYITGYPSSLGMKEMPQLEPSQPLLRKGIVAGKNQKLNTIILDCPVYKGNSGSPVVAALQDGLKTDFKLIGIVSEFVPFVEYWYNDKYGYKNIEFSNSGYSIIAPVDVMLELIKQFNY